MLKYKYRTKKEVTMKFNKDTKIGEILEVAPDKVDILLEIVLKK